MPVANAGGRQDALSLVVRGSAEATQGDMTITARKRRLVHRPPPAL
jgi:hypothetical protein